MNYLYYVFSPNAKRLESIAELVGGKYQQIQDVESDLPATSERKYGLVFSPFRRMSVSLYKKYKHACALTWYTYSQTYSHLGPSVDP